MPNYDQYLTPDAIVIYPHRGRVLLSILLGIVMVAVSFLLWKISDETGYRVVGAVGVVPFGFGSIYLLMRLVWPRPFLLITELGMVIIGSARAATFTRWDEINKVSIVLLRNQQFLAVDLKDASEFLGRQSFIKATIMRMNIGLIGTPYWIPLNILPMTLEDVIEKIRQKCPGILVE